jgi:hypothetical protein
VQFEEKQGTLLILNPSFHRRKVNVLWQHEVMTALGECKAQSFGVMPGGAGYVDSW